MKRIAYKWRLAGILLVAFGVTGYGTTVKVPTDTVTTTIKLRADREEIPIELRWSDGYIKKINVRPCDAKGWVAGKPVVMTKAGFEFEGLQIKAFVRPNIPIYKERLRKEYLEGWDRLPEIFGKDFTLCVRQDAAGVEFLLNGNHAGRLEHAGRLSEIASPLAGEQITFDNATIDPRFVQLDIGCLDNPGAMKGALVRLADNTIPFIAPSAANLDLGVTASHKDLYPNTYTDSGYTGRNAFDNARDSYLFTVPSDQYARAWVLCAVNDLSSNTPALNVRLTRFVPNEFYGGRARESIADTTVTLPCENAVRVGEVTVNGKTLPLWRVEAFLKTGEILDLITHPYTQWGPFKYGRAGLFFGPYLDFELTGKLCARPCPGDSDQMFPDPKQRSSLHVFGVTLEKAGADLVLTQSSQPGNIFYNDEVAEMKVTICPKFPGEYKLVWTIRDDTGKKVGGGELKTKEKKEVVIDLKQGQLGWYEMIIELFCAQRLLLTHRASFALLGQDTRQAGFDSPYGTWWFGSSHYSEGDIKIVGPLFLKAGFRRTTLETRKGVAKMSEKDYAEWKLTAHTAHSANKVTMTDEQLKEKLADVSQRFPHADVVLTFYEGTSGSGINAYQIAPELIGAKQTNVWQNADDRWECANQIGRVVRANFPHMKILLGNSLASTELIAEMLRRKLPREYVDYLGMETAHRTFHPERLHEADTQAASLMRETASKLGYDLPVTTCQESVPRRDELIGERRQAEWCVRDILLMHAYGFPHMSVSCISDAGNCYRDCYFGCGLTRRSPLLYPKKAYVAVATATKVLDRVKLVRQVPTGSRSVYALEFERADGNIVYAFWTSRGTAKLKLQLGSRRCERIGFYGASDRPWVWLNRLEIKAGTAAQYLVTDAKIQEITCGLRTYPDDSVLPGFRVVDPVDDPCKWELVAGTNPLLEHISGDFAPYRKLAKASLTRVDDPEKGRCLELDIDSNTNLPDLFNEYAVIRLKEPILLDGKPHTVGLWVKGNSGWGQIFWEIETANGSKMVSCGNRINDGDIFDYDGRVSIDYDGWNFLSLPISARSPIQALSTGSVADFWNRPTSEIRYPVKLTGLVFCAPPRPLFLANRFAHKQLVRLKDVGVISEPADILPGKAMASK